MKDQILKPEENIDVDTSSMDKEENLRIAKKITDIISDKKGRDIVLIDISAQSSFADFFVNTTAANYRMLDALQTEIENQLSPDGITPRSTEGKATSGWVLIDYGDIIVNIFLEEQRNTYQIEKIWSDSIFIDLEEPNVGEV